MTSTTAIDTARAAYAAADARARAALCAAADARRYADATRADARAAARLARKYATFPYLFETNALRTTADAARADARALARAARDAVRDADAARTALDTALAAAR